MDSNHQNGIDPRPKRRKDKDNPYEIHSVGMGTEHPHFYLSFAGAGNVKHHVEIDKALFDAFDQFELEDISYMHKVDRHYEQYEQTEAALHRRAVQSGETVEETVFRRIETELLYQAIAGLPEKQRRRLILYYFGSFTYEQIAAMEGCTKRAVKFSIDIALEKIKEKI